MQNVLSAYFLFFVRFLHKYGIRNQNHFNSISKFCPFNEMIIDIKNLDYTKLARTLSDILDLNHVGTRLIYRNNKRKVIAPASLFISFTFFLCLSIFYQHNRIIIMTLIYAYEPGTLHLSNHTNAKHLFLGFICMSYVKMANTTIRRLCLIRK